MVALSNNSGRKLSKDNLPLSAKTSTSISKEQEQTDLLRAVELYENRDHVQAFQLFESLAENCGNPTAHFNIGKMYHFGHGTPEDQNEAMRHYKIAANRGISAAWSNLAWIYDDGKVVPKDRIQYNRCQNIAAFPKIVQLIHEKIEENQESFEQIKQNQEFKNILITLRKYSCDDGKLGDFITGKLSLDSCLRLYSWIIPLFKRYSCLQFEKSYIRDKTYIPESYYLSSHISAILSDLIQFSEQDSREELNCKVNLLIWKIIEDENQRNFKGDDLRGVDLHWTEVNAIELEGADLRGAKSSDETIVSIITVQEKKYMELLKGQIDPGSVLYKYNFSPELINKIPFL